MRNYNHAFTLAEVLITLAIIGIVAAMTIPTLISKYEKTTTSIRLKQTYSILLNATLKNYQETSIPFSTYYVENRCPQDADDFYRSANCLYKDYLKENFSNMVQELNTALFNDTFVSDIHNAFLIYGKGFILPNGIGCNIYGGAIACITNYAELKKYKNLQIREYIFPGKNVFVFNVYHVYTLSDIKGDLLPLSQNDIKNYTREDLKTRCASKSSELSTDARFCTQLFINDGFKFKKDYPIKF